MRNFMHRPCLLAIIILMTSIATFASDFESDGIYYTILSSERKTVQVAPDTDNSYKNVSGALEIPSTVTHEGITYSVKSIGVDAFYGCSGLTSVTIPSSVTDIKTSAFSFCSNLTDIIVDADNPNYSSIDGILYDKYASELTLCPGGKKSVTIPSSVAIIGFQAFYGCSGLTSVTIPNSVTLINFDAFCDCRGLTSLTIPNSVTTIGENAFSGCRGLTSVIIGKSVTKIGGQAFASCSRLTSVTSFAVTPPTCGEWPAFDGVNKSNCTLYVPLGCKEAYQQASEWQSFTQIQEMPDQLTLSITGSGKVYRDSFNEVENGTEFEGTNFTFFVLPDDGNYIAAITLEGEDIMSNLVNHQLTISDFTIKGDGILKVEFKPEAEAYLTVNNADSHSVRHTYKEGTSATVEICPEEDWLIHSVTYNGEDVTNQLIDNRFATEPLHGENALNIVIVKNPLTDVNELLSANDHVRITVNGSTITINGLDSDEIVSVHDLSGKAVYSGFDRTMTFTPGNVYLLKTNSKTIKVAL